MHTFNCQTSCSGKTNRRFIDASCRKSNRWRRRSCKAAATVSACSSPIRNRARSGPKRSSAGSRDNWRERRLKSIDVRARQGFPAVPPTIECAPAKAEAQYWVPAFAGTHDRYRSEEDGYRPASDNGVAETPVLTAGCPGTQRHHLSRSC